MFVFLGLGPLVRRQIIVAHPGVCPQQERAMQTQRKASDALDFGSSCTERALTSNDANPLAERSRRGNKTYRFMRVALTIIDRSGPIKDSSNDWLTMVSFVVTF